jgi:hypothetical protein
MIESDLYKPIKKYFEEFISKQIGKEIKVEEAHGAIPLSIKELYPEIENILNVYCYSPDLIGIVKENKKNKLIIIEIKDDPLKLVDLYQAKRYSEIIMADYSFLLSPHNFSLDDEQFIKNEETSHLKSYYIEKDGDLEKKEIIVGIIELNLLSGISINNIDFESNIEL